MKRGEEVRFKIGDFLQGLFPDSAIRISNVTDDGFLLTCNIRINLAATNALIKQAERDGLDPTLLSLENYYIVGHDSAVPNKPYTLRKKGDPIDKKYRVGMNFVTQVFSKKGN